MIERIVGTKCAKFWQAIAHNKNVVESRNMKLHTHTTRNSGEMTTALTNAELNRKIIRYHAFINNQILGVDYWFNVEGDDMILGYKKEHLKVW